MPETLLHVERNSPRDVQNRQIYIRLDDAPFATLFYGKSAAKPIAPGEHTLVADNTWKKRKVTFTAAEGQTIAFRVTSRPGWGYTLLVGFFGAAPIEIELEPIDLSASPPPAS